MYSPFDFNQSIAHRAEYVEDRLKGGTPLVGLSYEGGILLFTVRRAGRKIFEIYDQLVMGAIGNQSDVEAVRLASIDFAHQEGFARSADDVSIQRLIGFAISPPLKRAFGDPMTTPNVMRAIFAEVNKERSRDHFFVLNYDGEFRATSYYAAIGGSDAATDAMADYLSEKVTAETTLSLEEALQIASDALRRGMVSPSTAPASEDEETETTLEETEDALQELLNSGGELEAAILERNTPRESKFRLLKAEELKI